MLQVFSCRKGWGWGGVTGVRGLQRPCVIGVVALRVVLATPQGDARARGGGQCRSPRAKVLSRESALGRVGRVGTVGSLGRVGSVGTPAWCHSPPLLLLLDGRRHCDISQQNLNIKMAKQLSSVSSAPKIALGQKDQVKPVKAEKPIKEKKLTGVHAQKDRVAPAKTALAF